MWEGQEQTPGSLSGHSAAGWALEGAAVGPVASGTGHPDCPNRPSWAQGTDLDLPQVVAASLQPQRKCPFSDWDWLCLGSELALLHAPPATEEGKPPAVCANLSTRENSFLTPKG